jgi:4-amino-4-deoxy-L-arabinose transferase-like glycosyltransferase
MIVLAAGMFLRLPPGLFAGATAPLRLLAPLHPQPKFMGIGFDENLYRVYANEVSRLGLTSYPDIVDGYVEQQKKLTGSILPPLRFLYIFAGYVWHELFGTEMIAALHNISALFSMLTLALATVFAARLRRPGYMLGVVALMAFAPTQLHMSQHALVDGFFTFWALLTLWALWENLRAPHDWRWLILYAIALAAVVLTKENSFFVWIGVIALLIANRWLKFGSVTRELLAATVLGPAIGVVILVWLAGGIGSLLTTYQLSVSKNYELKYAILTGDGPWHRYLVDLLLVSPLVLLLAIGSLFNLSREKKVEWFFVIFIAASYAVMANLKYGMNLRYANMWDLPLRVLAFSQLVTLAAFLQRWRTVALVGALAVISAFEFRSYIALGVKYPLYELVTPELMRPLKILKSAANPTP